MKNLLIGGNGMQILTLCDVTVLCWRWFDTACMHYNS